MSAIYWREKMAAAPQITHCDGMVVAQLGERVVLFPSEADARFFVEAYTDLPNIIGANETLQGWIDEGALQAARERVHALETLTDALLKEQQSLRVQLAKTAESAALANQRARLLAIAYDKAIGRKQP